MSCFKLKPCLRYTLLIERLRRRNRTVVLNNNPIHLIESFWCTLLERPEKLFDYEIMTKLIPQSCHYNIARNQIKPRRETYAWGELHKT